MTTATTEGRQLVLTVDGIDEPFIVDPIPARRGYTLTDTFMRVSLHKVPGIKTQYGRAESESVFMESIGPENYSRISGLYVDLVEFDAETGEAGQVLATFTPDGGSWEDPDHKSIHYYTATGALFMARPENPAAGEEYLDVESLRQEQAESLTLCAFYWQTVVGMEAVNAFIESGEDTMASVKALSLLMTRMDPLRGVTSLGSDGTQQSGAETPNTASGSVTTVRLPAHKKSINQNPAKRKARRR